MSNSRRTLLYALYVVAIVVLGVIIVRAIGGRNDDKPVAKHPETAQVQPSQTGAIEVSNDNTSDTTSSQSAATATRDALSQQAARDKLASTGPGDTLGLFAAVSLAGALAYRRYQLG